ncbi:MAG: hypothetical protein IKE85_02095 [Mogibacterium sp.]|nr:hypothetical protein [Mogibacterium sp.]
MSRIIKYAVSVILLLMLSFALAACGQEESTTVDAPADAEVQAEQPAEPKDEEEITMNMTINDTKVTVEWENNASVRALAELAKKGPVTIQMNAYGGFEQVGSIGETLPSSDTNIRTKAGDIMLYTSDHMVIFYGSNSWAYTRLGRITDKSASELRDLLSGKGVTVTVTAE